MNSMLLISFIIFYSEHDIFMLLKTKSATFSSISFSRLILSRQSNKMSHLVWSSLFETYTTSCNFKWFSRCHYTPCIFHCFPSSFFIWCFHVIFLCSYLGFGRSLLRLLLTVHSPSEGDHLALEKDVWKLLLTSAKSIYYTGDIL